MATSSSAGGPTEKNSVSGPLSLLGESSRRSGRFAHGLRGALIFLLGLLLASFPARNSDLWRHLASGRALWTGDYHFGQDPFAQNTTARYWVNPSWLTDLLGYGLYQLGGGPALVLSKALILAVLAVWLFQQASRAGGAGLAALITALTLVALGPYLDLQPRCLSLLFLALTSTLLMTRQTRAATSQETVSEARAPARRRWLSWLRQCLPLLVLLALWANLDEWYLLGPVSVLLWSLGRMLDGRWPQAAAEEAGGVRSWPRSWWLALIAAAGLVVLLNPHHVHILTAPASLDPTLPREFASEALGREQVLPTWRLLQEGTPGRWAYAALVLLGVLALGLNRGYWSWAEGLWWLGLLVLSLYRGAGVPFFAVVAGPLTARNLYVGWTRRRLWQPVAPSSWQRLLAAGSWLVLLGAVLSAWPGWLQGVASEPRCWTVAADPSLEALAPQLVRWRQEGRLPATIHLCNLSPGAGDYLAWACPGGKYFVDSRISLFSSDVLRDWQSLYKAIFKEDFGRHSPVWDLWRKYSFDCLLFLESEERRWLAGTFSLRRAAQTWRLVAVAGKAQVFVPALGARRLSWPTVDFEQLAFGPEAEPAPAQGLDRLPAPPAWWATWLVPRHHPNADREKTFFYLADFDARRSATQAAVRTLCRGSLAAALIGLGAGELPAGGLSLALSPCWTVLQLASAEGEPAGREREPLEIYFSTLLSRYYLLHDDGPLASLFLAVRAARRSLASEPRDYLAWLRLGQAYLRLRHATVERLTMLPQSLPEQLRRVQIITALAEALRLHPDLPEARAALAGFYEELGYWDLALREWQRYLEQGGLPGDDPRRRSLQEKVDLLARRVNDLRHQAATEAYSGKAVAQAQAALARGLVAQALDTLEHSESTDLGYPGALLELQLLLWAGRAAEVEDWLRTQGTEVLKNQDLLWLRVQTAAARGDYVAARADLRQLELPGTPPYATAVALLVADHLLARLPRPEQPLLFQALAQLDQWQRPQGELHLAQGLLALEEGQIAAAVAALRQAVLLSGPTADCSLLAKHYLDYLQRLPPRK
jgi:tetratricopeptide (TPR) repeat protein